MFRAESEPVGAAGRPKSAYAGSNVRSLAYVCLGGAVLTGAGGGLAYAAEREPLGRGLLLTSGAVALVGIGLLAWSWRDGQQSYALAASPRGLAVAFGW